MEPVDLARASFLFLPLVLLGLLVFPGRPVLRLLLAVVAAAIVALVLPLWLPRGILTYLASFSTMAGIYAILSLGLNSQWGLTGHVNFGVAGFFAVGAFTSALFTTKMPEGALAAYSQQAFGLEWPFLAGVLMAGIIAAFVGFLISIPVLRLRTDFLAIATLGIAEVIRFIFQNERWLANGPQPMRGIPRPLDCLFADPACSWLPARVANWLAPLSPRDYVFFYLVVVALIVAVVYLALERIARSPWGRMQRAVRDEENSAAMNGKNVTLRRIESFVVGSFIMGVAGAVYAHYVVSIDYSHFNPLFATFIVWVMLMLGGSGNNKGAILGAFAVWAVWSGAAFVIDMASPALRAISADLPSRGAYLRWMLVAILLGGIVLFRPQGILRERKKVSDFLPKDE
ncbi:branched-chain amino acid ABC transporter permease [Pontibaca salina]|uniref:Branched-chain amino acid ABC transporter permease n=1 Tax=Pontibaca salina TaxID=2795731 RepID=A0A934HIK2_9RHOB|nr:branched-chain amino acid ABC transporter permease [Pontibaca salina]MBI6628818.1 branched-chain amino acid ABC transporter permease [Pontibaca salina]